MSDSIVYGLVALVGLLLASFAAWKIVIKSKSNKVIAKGGSIAAGRDINTGNKSKKIKRIKK